MAPSSLASSLRRFLGLAAVGVLLASVVVQPADAHVRNRRNRVGHLWNKHLASRVLAQVTWTNLQGKPAGFADGVDDVGPPDAWLLGGNAGTVAGASFLGTTDDEPLELKVNGQRALRLELTETSPNVIAGFSDNSATAGVTGAAIGGGGDVGRHNLVTDSYGTISGGDSNVAGDGEGNTGDRSFATVGGGNNNRASGVRSTVDGGEANIASNTYASVGGGGSNTASAVRSTVGGGGTNSASGQGSTVGGGEFNSASGQGSTVGGGESNSASYWVASVGGGMGNDATAFASRIGGGRDNLASGDEATVGGGFNNTAAGLAATVAGGANNLATTGSQGTVGGGGTNIASGASATVPGGFGNIAAGDYSFAAGRVARIQDVHDGSFVFADQTNLLFHSAAANEFAVRSTGGARIVTAVDGVGVPTAGVKLDPGDTAWESLSDRAVKENIEAVEPAAVLAALDDVPITSWNYKAQDESVRHIGPMAQDFHAVFGLSDDERYISPIDTDGVALAAIQGLNRKVEALESDLAGRGGTGTGASSPMLIVILLAAAVALAGGAGLGLGLALGRRQAG